MFGRSVFAAMPAQLGRKCSSGSDHALDSGLGRWGQTYLCAIRVLSGLIVLFVARRGGLGERGKRRVMNCVIG